MELTGDNYYDTRFEPLKNALLGAFLGSSGDRTKLNMMLLPTFKKPINQLASGEDDTALIFNLLLVFNSTGQVTDLVRAANRTNPSYQALREFCNIHRQALIEDACQENLSGLESEQVSGLVAIVQQIIDFETIVKTIKSVLPPGHSDSENALKDLENPNLVTVLRLYGLLRLILYWFPKPTNTPLALEFAEALWETMDSADALSSLLHTWIQGVKQYLGLDATPEAEAPMPTSRRRPRTRSSILEASVMLIIEPTTQESPDKKILYRVRACLYFDQLKDAPRPYGQPLRPSFSLSLTDAAEEAFSECVFEKIPQQTDQYVNLALETLNNQEFKTELGYRGFELTVEFFLPLEHLDQKVDQWPLSRQGRDDVPLGRGLDRTMRSVIVRSFDRFAPFEDDNFRFAFEDAWFAWQDKLDQNQDLPIEHIEDWADYEAQNLEACFYEKAIIKISCGLPEQANDRQKLFRAAIDSHIPTAAWTRQNTFEGCDCLGTKLDDFLCPQALKDTSVLMQRLKTTRNEAWVDPNTEKLGDHLAVWLDDPYRLPPELQINDFST